MVKAAGEQESVPIFRTCPKEGHRVRIPLSQRHWMPGNSLITVSSLGRGEGEEGFIPVAVENLHCLTFLLPWQHLGECQPRLHESISVAEGKCQDTEVSTAGLQPWLSCSSVV